MQTPQNPHAAARLALLEAQHAQCKRAWFQDPTPRLGTALKQLEAALKYAKKQ